MSERERSDAGTFVETVSLDNVRDVFNQVRGPVVTSSDVADALGCTTEAARQKLGRLVDRGELDRRKTGRTVVYWRVEDAGPESGRETREERPATTSDPNPSRGSTVKATASTRTDGADPIGDALAGWDPDTETPVETAHAQTRRAAEWLRESGLRHKRTAFVDALADGSSLSGRVWWERAVQPGLRHLADAGLVEYRPGYHDYQYVGPAAGEESNTDGATGGA